MTRYEAFINPDWKKAGFAHIVLGRFSDNGRVETGYIFVDVFCLGVRDADYIDEGTEQEFREDLLEFFPADEPVRLHPACAKKLIEGAIAFSESLGFAPSKNYRKARKVFASIEAADCSETFVLGRNGRPYFRPIDEDTPERIERILRVLEAKAGPHGFDVEEDEEAFEEESDEARDEAAEGEEDEEFNEMMLVAEARETVADAFHQADSPYAFEYFVGMVMGAIASPSPISPIQLLPIAPGIDATLWQDPENAAAFTEALTRYWNLSAALLKNLLTDTDSDESPIDLIAWEYGSRASFSEAGTAWAGGFLFAVQQFPSSWTTVNSDPKLAGDWATLHAAADPTHERHEAVVADLVGPLGQQSPLGAAVVRIAQAARVSEERA